MPFPAPTAELLRLVASLPPPLPPLEELEEFAELLPRFSDERAYVAAHHPSVRDRARTVYRQVIAVLVDVLEILDGSACTDVPEAIGRAREAAWALYLLDRDNRRLQYLEAFRPATRH